MTEFLFSQTSFLHVGNHTYAAVKGGESYSFLKECFAPVWQEVAGIILDPTFVVGEELIHLEIVYGADFKVKTVMLNILVHYKSTGVHTQ